MIDVESGRTGLGVTEFVTKKLMDEDLILAAPDAMEFEVGKPVDLGCLATHNLILYPEYPRPSFADVVLKACQDAGFKVPRRVFTMDLQTALSLVAIGEGMCIVPASVGSAPRHEIKFLKLDPSFARTALSINYRLDEQGVHVQNFVKIAQSVARKRS